jgi:hypothetical protein
MTRNFKLLCLAAALLFGSLPALAQQPNVKEARSAARLAVETSASFN